MFPSLVGGWTPWRRPLTGRLLDLV